MSLNPSLRLKQLKKKQSTPALSLVFAEPQSSPLRATAIDTLDTVQAKNAPAADASPQAFLRRSPSLVSMTGTVASVGVSAPSARGSSRASKRRRVSNDTRVSPTSLSRPSTPVPASIETTASAPVERPPSRASTRGHNSGWFGSKKPSSSTNESPLPTVAASDAPAPSLALELQLQPEQVAESQAIPLRDPNQPGAAHVYASAPSRSMESTSSILTDTTKRRGGWFGFGGPPEVVPVSTSLPTMPFMSSPESSPTISQLPPLTPLTPPPASPRNNPSPTRSETIQIAESASNAAEGAPARKGWFGSLGRHNHSANESIASLPESIDSHTPNPDHVDNLVSPLASPVIVPVQQTVANINSSAQRYTLSIPLLGRPKIPLEALAKVERDLKGSGPEVMDVDFPPRENKLNSVPDVSESHGLEASGKELGPHTPHRESSWLSYIWSSAPAPSSQSLPVSPTVPVVELPSPAASNPELPITIAFQEQPHVPISSGSNWYTPWNWYTSPNEPEPELVASSAEDQSVNTFDIEPPVQSRSQSPSVEQVNENILLRTAEQRASWVGFFTSRSRSQTVKKLHDNEGGMEVMDLDVDIQGHDTSAGGSSTDFKETASIQLPPLQDKVKAAARNAVPAALSEPSSSKPPAVAMTDSRTVKHKVSAASRPASPAPSKKGVKVPIRRAPNLILPTFDDTFQSEPRLTPPPVSSALRRTLGMVRDSLFSYEEPVRTLGFDLPHHRKGDRKWAQQLPRAWNVFGDGKTAQDVRGLLYGCKRVVIIGVHGWFPGAIMRTVLGEPTGTSSKFASMMETAVRQYMDQHGHDLDQITSIPLEGEGTINHRVERLYHNLMEREDWVEDLHMADAVFVATHSQGSVVSTHLLHRLIHEGHIRIAPEESGVVPKAPTMPSWNGSQRVCCLSLCGIHLGPLTYLHQSSIVQPYLQYFESAAATELFQFQDTNSAVSKQYFEVLDSVLSSGVRFVYIASLDDQVVPIYSGTFTSISHPLVLRSLYIDGDAYNSSDFLSNLLILLLRLRNAGIDDAGLIALLSEATAGSLNGVGHSTAYEEMGTYTLAVRFLFEASGVLHGPAQLHIDRFAPRTPRNDYEIPWALRHILADPRVSELFSREIMELRAAFDDWQPKAAALKDIRRKLEPIRRLPTSRL